MNSRMVKLSLMSWEIAYPYEKKGKTVYITDPDKGVVPFEIVDKKTLKCEMDRM
ncbi:MAG: hypothetical protein KAZ87_11725 [Spirochaetes bacterium]|nr:hypothetical protein [Spirochaetota bacterium]